MENVKIRYTVKRKNGFVFSEIFTLKQIENGEVKTWIKANFINEKDIIGKDLFTGKKDATKTIEFPNGKDIYENDICKNNGGEIFKIFFDDDFCQFKAESGIGSISVSAHAQYLEIIGNRHQNQELLEE